MKDIEVSRTKLIEILKTNRAKHEADFKDAEVLYRQTAIKIMRENLEKAEAGGNIVKNIACDTPCSYVKQYDRAIGMLEMELNETVTLSVHDYCQYVEDEWAWSDSFRSTTMSYR